MKPQALVPSSDSVVRRDFVLRRAQALLAEARVKLVLATRHATPRERRRARAAALELAVASRVVIARELGESPEDVPWGAATIPLVEIRGLVEATRRLREAGRGSLDAWRATSEVLVELGTRRG